MKNLKFLVLAALILFSTPTFARDVYVHGYTKSNGTYVAPYVRSAPDNTVTNNYSYEGNVNPYTGTVGTNTYQHDITSPYYTGPDSQGNIGHDSNDPYYGR